MTDVSGYADRCVIDIETSVIPDAVDFLGQIEAPANYRKPESIAKYIEEARRSELEKAALDPDLCRIVSIAYQDVGADEVRGAVAKNEDEERKLLATFWKRMKSPLGGAKTLIGFNINDFDVPALMRRSLYLDVPFIGYEVGRYRHPRIVDLMQVLSHEGKLRYRSVTFYCRRFKIEEPDPLKSGAEVLDRVIMGDYDAVLAHNKADVRKEYRLAQAVGLL